MGFFSRRFPHLLESETKACTVRTPVAGLPAGMYIFLEFYCTDPACDCRRVLLQVWGVKQDRVLACIHYGWETEEFYTEFCGNPETARVLRAGVLDPDRRRSKVAPVLLRIFRVVLLRDKTYVARLKRHYEMFKRSIRRGSGQDEGAQSH